MARLIVWIDRVCGNCVDDSQIDQWIDQSIPNSIERLPNFETNGAIGCVDRSIDCMDDSRSINGSMDRSAIPNSIKRLPNFETNGAP